MPHSHQQRLQAVKKYTFAPRRPLRTNWTEVLPASDQIEYRLSTCPELCYGLFAEDIGLPAETLSRSIGLPAVVADGRGILLAHVIATKSLSAVVADADMAFPNNWKSNPDASATAGHQRAGKTVALHALAVSPAHQRAGLGTNLVKQYIGLMGQLGGVERISILTYDRLVPFYEKLGFELIGKSACNYGGIPWIDMSYSFMKTED
ncbi:Acyl-CoA N-acyltransferase [Moelleriella libera RCEF 2490]|uniref:Acyl-CoA N-acyltransferase n=1 Tax=Moelleriella libera RCEF 2490 TaxID=1081109 RepID=A0A166ND28_9HYPO|nr:Acyl-CoA N-acyltransferase [Moelleriella libera RCEF 2490]